MFFDKFLKASKKVFSIEQKRSSVVSTKEIKKSPDENLQEILSSLGNPGDLVVKRIEDNNKTYAIVIHFETLVDSNLLEQKVIEPINRCIYEKTGMITANQLKLLISVSKLTETENMHDAVDLLLSGNALILIPENKTISG